NNNVRYLLKYPLRVGTQWLSVTGITSVEKYRIIEMNRRIRVPAGSFSRCLVVRAREQRAGQGAVEALFYFAPRVGLVKSVSTREYDGKRLVYNVMELVSYRFSRSSSP
ncbi:MAG: hypothetical protein AAGJ35_05035, partial [Myxococcota bacterium]